MCPGYKFFQNVNISFEICVNVFQLIANVTISFEIYKFCPGYKFFQNVIISFEIGVNVLQLIQTVIISLEICANVFGSPMDPYKDPKNVNI